MKLPDASALGPAPRVTADARTPHYSAAGFESGAIAMAEATQKFGRGINDLTSGIASGVQQESERRDQLNEAFADSQATITLSQLRGDLSRDPEYETAPQRLVEQGTQKLDEIGQQYLGGNPRRLEMWKARNAVRIEHERAHLDGIALTRTNNQMVADANDQADELGARAVRGEISVAQMRDDMAGLYNGLVGTRQYTPKQAQIEIKRRAEKYANERFAALPPEEREKQSREALQRWHGSQDATQPQAGGQDQGPQSGGKIAQNQSGVRTQPISPDLSQQLTAAGRATGVDVSVTSGGQPAFGPRSVRTGSHRHDLGGAADLQLRDAETGRLLDMTVPEDQQRIGQFMTEAVRAGANGIGAAPNYMGPNTIHVGGGAAAAWGAGGSSANAPPWVQRALADGMRARRQSPTSPPAGGTQTAPAPQGPLNLGVDFNFAQPWRGTQPAGSVAQGQSATGEQSALPSAAAPVQGPQPDYLTSEAPVGNIRLPGFDEVNPQRIGTKTEADLLTPRQLLIHNRQARAELNAQRIDQDRMSRAQERQREQVSKGAEDEYLQNLYGDNPTAGAKQIVSDPRLTPSAKERMVRVAERATKPEPMARVSQATTMDLLDRMRLEEGNPRRISDTGPIFDAYIGGKLTTANFNFLNTQFKDMRTPEGETLGKRQGDFMKAIGPQIDPTGDILPDPDAKMRLYKFQTYVHEQVDRYRKDGKNVYDLFNPNKPEFLGTPEALKAAGAAPPSLQDKFRARAEQMKAPEKPSTPGFWSGVWSGITGESTPAAAPAAPVAPANPNVQQRLPGESLPDWMARTGRGINMPAPDQQRPQVPFSRYASGGVVPGGRPGGPTYTGPMIVPAMGKADSIHVNVPRGSYILPADIPSALGQGNSLAGHARLNGIFGVGSQHHDDTDAHAILVSGGEHIIAPREVDRAGGPDAIDKFVERIRGEYISKLENAADPKRGGDHFDDGGDDDAADAGDGSDGTEGDGVDDTGESATDGVDAEGIEADANQDGVNDVTGDPVGENAGGAGAGGAGGVGAVDDPNAASVDPATDPAAIDLPEVSVTAPEGTPGAASSPGSSTGPGASTPGTDAGYGFNDLTGAVNDLYGGWYGDSLNQDPNSTVTTIGPARLDPNTIDVNQPDPLSFVARSGGGNVFDPAAYGQPDTVTGVQPGTGAPDVGTGATTSPGATDTGPGAGLGGGGPGTGTGPSGTTPDDDWYDVPGLGRVRRMSKGGFVGPRQRKVKVRRHRPAASAAPLPEIPGGIEAPMGGLG